MQAIEIHDELQAWLDTAELVQDRIHASESDDDRRAAEADMREIQGRIAGFLRAGADRVDALVHALDALDGQAEVGKRIMDRIAQRVRQIERAHERLKQSAISALEAIGVRRMEGRASRISLRACPASVVFSDGARIPRRFQQLDLRVNAAAWDDFATTLSPDQQMALGRAVRHSALGRVMNSEIKKAIEDGESVPGADLAMGKNTLIVK